MSGIPDEVLQEVRSRADILQVIGSFVSLKKAGTRYRALCPFHSEKTPSFHVQPQVGRYHCFGCQANGDVFEFIMRHEGKTFPEAVREVASRFGVDVPEDSGPAGAGGAGGSAHARARKDRREELLAVNDLAAEFFEKCLSAPGAGAPGRAYLQKRGVPEKVQASHRLGWAPDRWDALGGFLEKRDVKAADAEELGLLVARQGQDGHYDRFRNRVIFPVLGQGGRVVGFGGRTLSADKTVAKYINSPESDLYKKGRELYGLHPARRAIRAEKLCVLVEGNVDVLSLCAAGIENVAAIMGTALTPDQAKLLARYTRDIIICFDGDAAGRAATLKSAPTILEAGLSARVISLPDGEDPDSFVRRLGAEQAGKTFREMIAAAPELVDHVVQVAVRGQDGTVPGKLRALTDVAGLLWRIADDLARELYVRRVAELLGVREEDVREAGRRAARTRLEAITRPSGQADAGAAAPDAPLLPGAEPHLIALLLRFVPLRAKARALDASRHVTTRTLKELCERLLAPVPEGGAELTVAAGMEGLEGAIREAVSLSMAREDGVAEATAEREITDCAFRLEWDASHEELREVEKQIDEARRRGDVDREHERNRRFRELSTEIARLKAADRKK
jgi:DNA primase